MTSSSTTVKGGIIITKTQTFTLYLKLYCLLTILMQVMLYGPTLSRYLFLVTSNFVCMGEGSKDNLPTNLKQNAFAAILTHLVVQYKLDTENGKVISFVMFLFTILS